MSENTPIAKNAALIGSSGGGTATLGHTDPPSLLRIVHEQLQLCGGRLVVATFVALDGGKGMDGANEETEMATAFTVEVVQEDFNCIVRKKGTLKEVNLEIREKEDERIAREILDGYIDGLICISCHTGLFKKTLTAAATKKIPVTGSGGTSLSQAVAEYGLKLSGNAGGSVATTSFSRAVSFAYALAGCWGRDYRPWETPESAAEIQWTSVLNACLPAFWGVCVAKQMLLICCEALEIDLDPAITGFHKAATHTVQQTELLSNEIGTSLRLLFFGLEYWALPTACAVIMATSSSELGGTGKRERDHFPLSSLLMSSTIACTVCSQSILGGLLAGWLVRRLADRILFQCIVNNVPATMTNLVSTGGTGCIVAVMLLPLTPILRQCTELARSSISWTVVGLSEALVTEDKTSVSVRAAIGFLWGCFFCYGAKVGWYHAYFLPAILFEMERGEASFLGAIDELSLVLVCAGVCSGNLTAQKFCDVLNLNRDSINDTDASLCRRGLRINLLYGDFVEACYPFMEQSTVINVGGYLASGCSSAWLVASMEPTLPKSLAYLPLPLSVALALGAWRKMLGAALMAFAIAFLASFVNPFISPTKKKQS